MKYLLNCCKFLPALCPLVLISCGSGDTKEIVNPSYAAEIKEWHEMRFERLKSPNGWLSLVGLYWLKDGENSFGADPSNDLVFPAGKAPGLMGSLYLHDGSVRMRVEPGVEIYQDTILVKEMILLDDTVEETTILTAGSLSWNIIKRGERFAIRLKDSENPKIDEFEGIDMFPTQSRWRFKATFEPYDPPKEVLVPTILGTIEREISPGALSFKIDRKTYRLDALAEPGDKYFFMVFADETNGYDTYGGGRFLYVDAPGDDGTTVIDFNKAYNPPCVFTEYATCPLPPRQNRLALKVTAGEKKWGRLVH